MSAETAQDARLDLILQQIGALPTLSPVAVRVMAITESDGADLRELSRLIGSDPVLSAKVLALCRKADLGVSGKITTVDRAVIMLGLDAVRAAMLSVEVYAAFERALERDPRGGPKSGDEPAEFDRTELWRHALGVACAAEMLAQANGPALRPFSPQEAFLAGLLHDLGKLALDAVLPRTYARVAELAASRQMNIADVERKVIGLDHHAAGKRLGEHWGLPHALQDVMWLHGQEPATLPDVPHRRLIGVVSAADALARRLHLGWSGNFAPPEEPQAACERHGLGLPTHDNWEARLSQRVAQRAEDLGLKEATTDEMLLRCLSRANARLGRLSALVEERARGTGKGSAAIDRVAAFLATERGNSGLVSAMERVARSAAESLGKGAMALVMQARDGAPWSMHRLTESGEVADHASVQPPEGRERLAELLSDSSDSAGRAAAVAWLGERARELCGGGEMHMLTLCAGNGLAAALMHQHPDASKKLSDSGLRVLAGSWGAALVSAAKHEGARRLGENLADANRRLSEAQGKLVEAEALARLGQMTAGAAHEMNNPMAVISGQAQLLLSRAPDAATRRGLEAIVGATTKLSDLIASLHLFAESPEPKRRGTDIGGLLRRASDEALKRFRGDRPGRSATQAVRVSLEGAIPRAHLDADQICLSVTEVILNALQAGPKSAVDVRAHIDAFDGRLVLSVIDDGAGMSDQALRHACDPFFSELPAGRRAGLGLARARRCVELHGGEIVLESTQGKGTVVRIAIPQWRDEGRGAGRERAA